MILPVSDWASLEEAEKTFRLLRRFGDERKGRVLFTLVDRRTRVDRSGRDLYERLATTTDERGWPRFQAVLSRSPRVEALNSGTGIPGSVLHHARHTAVHRQFRELAEEVSKLLSLGSGMRPPGPLPEPTPRPRNDTRRGLKNAFLRGFGSR